jgi:hypothetical protein
VNGFKCPCDRTRFGGIHLGGPSDDGLLDEELEELDELELLLDDEELLDELGEYCGSGYDGCGTNGDGENGGNGLDGNGDGG